MERLTKRFDNGRAYLSIKTKAKGHEGAAEAHTKAINRLCELEDKLASGQIVELPLVVNSLSPKYVVIVFRGKNGKLYKTHTFEAKEAEARLKELQEK